MLQGEPGRHRFQRRGFDRGDREINAREIQRVTESFREHALRHVSFADEKVQERQVPGGRLYEADLQVL